jgi:hypothetical protein
MLGESMETMVDISNASDEEIRSEMAGAQEFLAALTSGAPLGLPFEGRDEAKMQELRSFIAACQSELDRRNAARS